LAGLQHFQTLIATQDRLYMAGDDGFTHPPFETLIEAAHKGKPSLR
jgi:hypothetical protein